MFENNINGFGMGMNPGFGMMGGNVKITQTTSGMGRGGSIFSCPSYSSTSINVTNGPSGFLGGLAGFLTGFNGGSMFGGNMFSGGMMGGGMMSAVGGYRGSIPSFFSSGAFNGGGIAGATQANQNDPELAALKNLDKNNKWSITKNPNGTFTAILEAKYNKAGTQVAKTGDYYAINDFICDTETTDPQTQAPSK